MGWRLGEGDLAAESTPLAFDGGQTFTLAGAPVVRDTS